MTALTLKELKVLIRKEKMMAPNPKCMRYSKSIKEKIATLTRTISCKELSKELNISRSFVEKLKRTTNNGKKNDFSPPIKLLDLSNSFVKDDSSNLHPVMKLTTARGLTIEIFE